MKRGTPRHPKTAALQRELKIPLPTVVGYLELLFHFTAEFAPQGDIGKYADDWIEASLGWTGKPGRLVSALIASHWIEYRGDCRLVVHDWHDHADESVKLRLKRASLPFLSNQSVREFMSGQRGEVSPSRARALPEPEPEPHIKPRSPVSDSKPSGRFEEWWAKYPRKVGRERAAHAWCFLVTEQNENQVFAAEDRYVESEEVSRGVVMGAEKWLNTQNADGWSGMWPAKNGSAKQEPYKAKNEWTET